MKVRIGFVTDADGNPDTARIGGIEDLPDREARRLVKEGVAAVATEQDFADAEAAEAYRQAVADAESVEVEATATPSELGDVETFADDSVTAPPDVASQPTGRRRAAPNDGIL